MHRVEVGPACLVLWCGLALCYRSPRIVLTACEPGRLAVEWKGLFGVAMPEPYMASYA